MKYMFAPFLCQYLIVERAEYCSEFGSFTCTGAPGRIRRIQILTIAAELSRVTPNHTSYHPTAFSHRHATPSPIMTDAHRVRLHITPFNADLVDLYIPPSIKPVATNISFHTIETFPGKDFGYVELPAMEAQKLKKKLNGSTLKGSKVKIEEARPEKKRKSTEPAEEDADRMGRKKVKKDKSKPKATEKVLPGHELEEGRHIKRGWVEDKTKGKKAREAGIEGKKMTFKTLVPPNKANSEKDVKKSKTKTKEKKEKAAKSSKKEVLVKEGEMSTTPAAGGRERKTALTYEEGTGWLDNDGEVVEPEPPSKKRRREKKAVRQAEAEQETELQQDLIVEEAPVLNYEPDDDTTPEIAHAGLPTREAWSGDEESASDTSSSSVSSVSSDSESEDEGPDGTDPAEDSEAAVDRQLERARSNTVSNKNTQTPEATSLPVGQVQEGNQPAAKEIHPLEALFKRAAPRTPSEEPSKPKPAPIDTSFSFFNSSADAEDEDLQVEVVRPPQTPHTKQDLEWRSIRSAAPTPDTAAIGKRFDFSFSNDQVDEDENMADAELPHAQAGAARGDSADGEKKEESEFRKWFYENRGDLNRSWKKRRREERKVGRQRENRRVGRRVA